MTGLGNTSDMLLTTQAIGDLVKVTAFQAMKDIINSVKLLVVGNHNQEEEAPTQE